MKAEDIEIIEYSAASFTLGKEANTTMRKYTEEIASICPIKGTDIWILAEVHKNGTKKVYNSGAVLVLVNT